MSEISKDTTATAVILETIVNNVKGAGRGRRVRKAPPATARPFKLVTPDSLDVCRNEVIGRQMCRSLTRHMLTISEKDATIPRLGDVPGKRGNKSLEIRRNWWVGGDSNPRPAD